MRALVVGLAPGWLGIARLPGALKQAGFEVAAFGRAGSYLLQTRHLDRRWSLAEAPPNLVKFLAPLGEAVAAWQPRVIIPGDDLAVQVLHRAVLSGRLDERPDRHLARLVREALSDPGQFGVVEAKSRLIELARSLGMRTPAQLIAPGVEAAQAFADREGLPVILKPDLTQAGQGVRICRSRDELAAAIREYQPAKNVASEPGAFAVQSYVDGLTVAATFVALRGEILAAFQFAKFRSQPAETGPVSVARRIEGDDLADALRPLIAHVGYNGFAGADFVRSHETGETFLLELNARPTPTIHLGRLFGVDLAAALRAAIAGEPMPPRSTATVDQVTLFPQEWQGEPQSPYLHEGLHDVPWDDLPLLAHIVKNAGLGVRG